MKPTLLGHDVTVRFGEVAPLDGLDFTFTADDFPAAVTGPSGSGKTTLLRVVSGALIPDKGVVLIDDEPVAHPSWRSSGDRRVGFIHQDYRLVQFLTVGENLRLACEAKGARDITDEALREALDQVGLTGIGLKRNPSTLSGGEQQRVAIARTLLAGCTVLLADEPTGALDEENTAVVSELFGQLVEDLSVAVLIATHDPAVATRAAARFRMGGGGLWRVD